MAGTKSVTILSFVAGCGPTQLKEAYFRHVQDQQFGAMCIFDQTTNPGDFETFHEWGLPDNPDALSFAAIEISLSPSEIGQFGLLTSMHENNNIWYYILKRFADLGLRIFYWTNDMNNLCFIEYKFIDGRMYSMRAPFQKEKQHPSLFDHGHPFEDWEVLADGGG